MFDFSMVLIFNGARHPVTLFDVYIQYFSHCYIHVVTFDNILEVGLPPEQGHLTPFEQ